MRQWRYSLTLAVAITLVTLPTFAGLPVNAQSLIVSAPTTTSNWSIWADSSAAATVATADPGSANASEILYPTNVLSSWGEGFTFPDQTKLSLDGDAIRVDVGKVDDDKTSWKTFVYQRDLPLQEGKDYVVKFNAKADVERPAYVTAQNWGGDWHDLGLSQQLDLTTTWQSFSFPFTAAGLTPDGSGVAIHMGEQTGTVWVSDVSLAPAAATVAAPAPSSALQISITKPGDHPWSIGLSSAPFDLVNGNNYVLTYYAKSDVPRKIQTMVRINSDDYHDVGGTDYDAIAGPSWRLHRVAFTAKNVKQENNVVSINVGAVGTGTVSIGDVQLAPAPAK